MFLYFLIYKVLICTFHIVGVMETQNDTDDVWLKIYFISEARLSVFVFFLCFSYIL